MDISINYLIIGFTSVISFLAFNNHYWSYKLKHWPYQEARNGEYYRWLTSGFLHADPMHLIFNMITLYFFGAIVEQWFKILFPETGSMLFLLFYLVAILAASSATYVKYRQSPGFASIGASGAVAAVLFASILLMPTNLIFLFFIPMPAVVFGVAYLWYSAYAAKRGGDNIDHTAHYYGAIFGFIFPIVLEPGLLPNFVLQLRAWLAGFGI
ncbi:MAG: rhomboid family intramembrane serine protease [Saprospiraceae bacterium]|nr:rhomboid family intramembrane serine protease [Saprospiraceae bacterium]